MTISDLTYKAAQVSGKFGTKDRAVIEKALSDMSIEDILELKGFGERNIIRYAKEAGREAELLRIDGLKLPGNINQDMVRRDMYRAKLAQEFETQTFNDELNLDRLAELYTQRYNLSRTTMADLDTDGTRAAKQLDDMIIALEKHLQIDPQTRAAAAAAADPAAIIGDWVEQSALYLADEGVIHDTDNGPAGYTFWHFKTPEYMPRCAACGGQHFVFRSPWDEKDHEFTVARPDQIKRYVKGRDFKPLNAPSLSIFEEKPE